MTSQTEIREIAARVLQAASTAAQSTKSADRDQLAVVMRSAHLKSALFPNPDVEETIQTTGLRERLMDLADEHARVSKLLAEQGDGFSAQQRGARVVELEREFDALEATLRRIEQEG
jgi:hypothetical protein